MPILFSIGYMDFTPCGFPHSEIRGSTAICALPRLIAACHVLLRLPVPRHPPCALSCLTFANHALCNLVLSCSLCVLNLSLHEFCKTTFVPTYILTRQNCYLQQLYFLTLIVFPTAAFSIRFSYSVLKVHSLLFRASQVFHKAFHITSPLCDGLKWTRTTDLALIRRAL